MARVRKFLLRKRKNSKDYYYRNQEEVKKKQAEYREKNREALRKRASDCNQRRKEKDLRKQLTQLEYERANPGRSKKYYEANKENILKQRKEYRLKKGMQSLICR